MNTFCQFNGTSLYWGSTECTCLWRWQLLRFLSMSVARVLLRTTITWMIASHFNLQPNCIESPTILNFVFLGITHFQSNYELNWTQLSWILYSGPILMQYLSNFVLEVQSFSFVQPCGTSYYNTWICLFPFLNQTSHVAENSTESRESMMFMKK